MEQTRRDGVWKEMKVAIHCSRWWQASKSSTPPTGRTLNQSPGGNHAKKHEALLIADDTASSLQKLRPFWRIMQSDT